MSSHPARRLWAALETLHDVTYFAPEVRAAGMAQGLKGFWMTYFAWRAAPLGPVPAAPVVAMFAGFHPGTVARALPEAWSRASRHARGVARDHASGSARATVPGWNPANMATTGAAGTGPSGAARHAK